MAQYTLRNNGDAAFALPTPFSGVLQPGESRTFDGTPDAFLTCCGKNPGPWVTITIEPNTIPSAGTGILDSVSAAVNSTATIGGTGDVCLRLDADGLIAGSNPVTTQANLGKIISGSLSFGAAEQSKTASVGTAYNGKPVIASFGQADNGDAKVITAVIAGGTLTITTDAVPGVGKTAKVFYIIDGR